MKPSYDTQITEKLQLIEWKMFLLLLMNDTKHTKSLLYVDELMIGQWAGHPAPSRWLEVALKMTTRKFVSFIYNLNTANDVYFRHEWTNGPHPNHELTECIFNQ